MGLMIVKLNWFEVLAGAFTGVTRRVESIRKGYKNSKGFDRDDVWDIDINGACAELAAAKCMNRYWNASVNGFKKGDIGNYQVRLARGTTPYLLFRKNDNPNAIFILVNGVAPTFKVMGWMKGSEGMKSKYLRSFGGRPDVYAVPPDELHKMTALPREKDGKPCPLGETLDDEFATGHRSGNRLTHPSKE